MNINYLFCFLAICDVTRHLDDCKHRIHPMEKLYGHYNTETTTIYHCDCIKRSLNVMITHKNQSSIHYAVDSQALANAVDLLSLTVYSYSTPPPLSHFLFPHRLTDHLKQLESIALLEKLLWKFVSMSCIEIPNTKGCNNNTRFGDLCIGFAFSCHIFRLGSGKAAGTEYHNPTIIKVITLVFFYIVVIIKHAWLVTWFERV